MERFRYVRSARMNVVYSICEGIDGSAKKPINHTAFARKKSYSPADHGRPDGSYNEKHSHSSAGPASTYRNDAPRLGLVRCDPVLVRFVRRGWRSSFTVLCGLYCLDCQHHFSSGVYVGSSLTDSTQVSRDFAFVEALMFERRRIILAGDRTRLRVG